jgi:hypothetical protein
LSSKNILLAVVPKADLRLRRVLAGHALRSVRTLERHLGSASAGNLRHHALEHAVAIDEQVLQRGSDMDRD